MVESPSDRPPSIIVHLIRHASSNHLEGGLDFGLSSKGERQCDELYESMRKHAGYITHIFCSPMKRCLETARKGLLEATNRGTRIQIMPALAGRNGQAPWNLREENQENDISGPWVSEVADPRSKSKDADFVMKWLTGKDLSVQAAQKVLEVVVVSQAQLLNDLLWKLKGGNHGWPNATIVTYILDRDGKWTHCRLQKTIDKQRNSQQDWKKRIVEAAHEEQRKREKKTKKEQAEKLDKQKRELLKTQDFMLVVDRETDEIVTFGRFQELLKERYAKEFSSAAEPVVKKAKPVERNGNKKPVGKKPKPVAKKLKPVKGKVKAKAALEKSEPVAKKRKRG
ncbi:hypothetical protein BELL_0271g00110 [Botrytis elliptica]|uniref:Phosphoglycerate mutase family protein n=1 Tax=Botrytis elliptica TaxID=278938 RepID=A0A4Z1JZQ8_9HELO|nr:hypothetical protein EAE99_010470 [Botrytis elliptica]TGO74573.1 hypothetical protein BELL_0271g00110 [Botrytis elliptica]